ncbi:MAG TPA: nucleotidyl transferase AbiEii/AbiGii toxin family protein [Phenylobacterium sp.]|jgi:predicted nucleotidyltransferase component of viral defense system
MAVPSCALSDRPDLTTLLEVQEYFSLPSPALVEKDWHVVQALAAISGAASDGLTLVFGGGTALGRAHGLLARMSEDIDLRIVGDQATSRPALKRLRQEISERLKAQGFEVEGHVAVKQSDRYVRYDLPYAPIAAGEGVLRPEIKIEAAAFPIRRPAVVLPVRSFIAEAAKRDPEVPGIPCVSLVETAAEKFVALTRRTGAVFAGAPADNTLVRHIYDLTRLEGQYDPDDCLVLAWETMVLDAQERGYEAYKADPLAETRQTVARMTTDEAVRGDYDLLLAGMVYGEKPPFEVAIGVLQAFAERL